MAPPEVKEVLPSRGALFHEEIPQFVLCKPKLLPLKSITLEKVENMQREAEEKAKETMKLVSASTLLGNKNGNNGSV
ncbi:BBSome-interacting protein 1-like [Tropilaelaps mercedesae]|uniref:BBSome-interacting protein 1-like n=1 Tax=Tropilaelaps mercedesae TaxID=418985 RepID=A0A1V9XJ60_9ACAR|nr:BBSome-interacting protein 1-like [Tropilaelaps mercedesae]